MWDHQWLPKDNGDFHFFSTWDRLNSRRSVFQPSQDQRSIETCFGHLSLSTPTRILHTFQDLQGCIQILTNQIMINWRTTLICHEKCHCPSFQTWEICTGLQQKIEARYWCRFACDERWMNITRSIRLKGGSQHENIKQPTWCQLEPEDFGRIVHRASTKYPENVMFARQTVQGASDAMQKAQREKEGHVIGSENEISHSEESITDEESWEESSSRAGGMQKHARSQKLRGSRKDQ